MSRTLKIAEGAFRTLTHCMERVYVSTLRMLFCGNNGAWFSAVNDRSQDLTSASTNTVDQDPSSYTGPTVYSYDGPPTLWHTLIADNTEGIAAFDTLVQNGEISTGSIVLNLGGGAFDGPSEWLRGQVEDVQILVADPFRRTSRHNTAVQEELESGGGADVVVSASVLNVVQPLEQRLHHFDIAQRALKPGGRAFFFVWAGSWPVRGTGEQEINNSRQCFQANAWAHTFLLEARAMFGYGNCVADPQLNLLICQKQH